MDPLDLPPETLIAIARQHGTPTYAYDLARIRSQVERLRSALPPEVGLLYSLKANPSLGICSFLADCGLGADVASAGELVTALEAGFDPREVLVAGPFKSPETLALLEATPGPVLSIDSASELEWLAARGRPLRALLRLRPDFATCAVVATGPDSRFGVALSDLPRCRESLAAGSVELVGFHVFAGSQVLDASAIARQLGAAADLAIRAADLLGVRPTLLDLGGGFGIPYRPDEEELDLGPVGKALSQVLARVAPARVVLELGRFLVAQAGWYLTSVAGEQQHAGRRAVVVDGGTHQRADLCGLGLRCGAFPPIALRRTGGKRAPTDVLGCLSAPGDVLAEAAPLPPLAPGDVLAFPNAGAYGLAASPWSFHGQSPPAEVAFDGAEVSLIRPRQPARAVLGGQALLR